MRELISIIVPVYGVERYLTKCVESIRNQSYSNIEIVIVDDGSVDKSSIICDYYGLKDDRVIVIHKANGGLSEARNIGMNYASGQYYAFVDSDDYIHPEMYKSLHKIIKNNNAQLAECGIERVDEQEICTFKNMDDKISVFNRNSAIKELIESKSISTVVWNKLIDARIVKEVPFDVGKIHEDILWVYRALNKCNITAVTRNIYYAYVQHENSISNKYLFTLKRIDSIDAYQERARLIGINQPELYLIAEKAYIGNCMYQYQVLCRSEKFNEREKLKYILYKRYVDGDRKKVFSDDSLKNKMWHTSFVIAPDFTCLIRNILGIGL